MCRSSGGVGEQAHFWKVEREEACSEAGHLPHSMQLMQLVMSASSAAALERSAFPSLLLQCPHQYGKRPGTKGGGT